MKVKSRIKYIINVLFRLNSRKYNMINNNELKNYKQCSKCKEVLEIESFNVCNKNSDKLQSYCRKCQSEYKYNDEDGWCKQYTGYYLYIILHDKEVKYVGMTTNYYDRITYHLNCNVEATKDIFKSNNWTSIKYIDLTDIVNSEMELRMLENTLIDLYEPSNNSVKNIIKGMDKLRELELCSYLHSALSGDEWKTYKTNT